MMKSADGQTRAGKGAEEECVTCIDSSWSSRRRIAIIPRMVPTSPGLFARNLFPARLSNSMWKYTVLGNARGGVP